MVIFVIQGSKIGALNYSDIESNAHTIRFIESESVSRDAQVVGRTWKYIISSESKKQDRLLINRADGLVLSFYNFPMT